MNKQQENMVNANGTAAKKIGLPDKFRNLNKTEAAAETKKDDAEDAYAWTIMYKNIVR